MAHRRAEPLQVMAVGTLTLSLRSCQKEKQKNIFFSDQTSNITVLLQIVLQYYRIVLSFLVFNLSCH